jgi:UDP-glucose 4-epimerase
MVGSSSQMEHTPYDVAYEEGFEDMQRRVPDTTKIRSLTGWEPTRSLDKTIEAVIAYQQAEIQERIT